MVEDRRGWLLRHHPVSYGFLSVLFALPGLFGLLITWPDLASLPAAYPGQWGTVALFATLVSVGMGLRSMTPAAELVDPSDEHGK